MTAGCQSVFAAAEVGWLDPSTITSLMPLWLVVLMADGLDPSTACSLPLNDIWFSKPASQSRGSSMCWLAPISGRPCGNGDVGSSAMDCGESL